MADRTPIEWTDATWNPVRGCSRVSEGCRHCYAEIITARFSGPGDWGHGLAEIVGPPGKRDHRWTGKVALAEHLLDQPLRWRRPRRIFVNSTSDLFHEAIPDDWIDRVFAVMALAPQHTFQVLTKRPERMRDYLGTRAGDWMLHWPDAARKAGALLGDMPALRRGAMAYPLPNVWLGVSVEDQAAAVARIPPLLATPAAKRFISAEPLLGPVNLRRIRIAPDHHTMIDALDGYAITDRPGSRERAMLDWVIAGGESGPGARPMHPDWPRALRDQCAAAGVPFFFKQWGEWWPTSEIDDATADDLYWPAPETRPDDERRCRFESACVHADGSFVSMGQAGERHKVPAGAFDGHHPMTMFRVGKKLAGATLDGRELREFPA